MDAKILADIKISIHAPARRATRLDKLSTSVGEFQFTPPRGGRHGSLTFLITFNDFNSRPREEGDFDFQPASFQGNHFNSRPREEGDSHKHTCACDN